MTEPVVVVGAGLAGLNCARVLHENGLEVLVLESEDIIGGRVQTDEVDGFLLDRGFQVLLTEYPEAQQSLDYDRLELHHFRPGALVRLKGRFHQVSDPFRDPAGTLGTLTAPVGSVLDKLRILKLRSAVSSRGEDQIFQRPETTTIDALRNRGFSPKIIERFFRPFFGGIMLDRTLRGSSRMFEYVFRMFSLGSAAVPADGMRRIPSQLAGNLPLGTVRLETRAAEVRRGEVVASDGERFKARAIVVAVDGPGANTLFGNQKAPSYVSTYNLYFSAEHLTFRDPVLVLNGDGIGPINNVAVMTNVAGSYSETGRPLISVTVLGDWEGNADLEPAVRQQLADWFGDGVAGLSHLRTYHIRNALPDQQPPFLNPPRKDVRVEPGIYRAGDYLDTASINGALLAGRRAAEALIADSNAP
ncbi:MAG: FAD-dependent oxidoreductase [Rhodothermia bacterium]|nr:FAD-dependent oxidoreductase [Rhodothermia bacterium]